MFAFRSPRSLFRQSISFLFPYLFRRSSFPKYISFHFHIFPSVFPIQSTLFPSTSIYIIFLFHFSFLCHPLFTPPLHTTLFSSFPYIFIYVSCAHSLLFRLYISLLFPFFPSNVNLFSFLLYMRPFFSPSFFYAVHSEPLTPLAMHRDSLPFHKLLQYF